MKRIKYSSSYRYPVYRCHWNIYSSNHLMSFSSYKLFPPGKYFHLAIVTIILYNLLTKSTKMQVSLKVGWLTWILEDLFARPFCFLRVVCSFLMFGYAINLIEFSSKKIQVYLMGIPVFILLKWFEKLCAWDIIYFLQVLNASFVIVPKLYFSHRKSWYDSMLLTLILSFPGIAPK